MVHPPQKKFQRPLAVKFLSGLEKLQMQNGTELLCDRGKYGGAQSSHVAEGGEKVLFFVRHFLER